MIGDRTQETAEEDDDDDEDECEEELLCGLRTDTDESDPEDLDCALGAGEPKEGMECIGYDTLALQVLQSWPGLLILSLHPRDPCPHLDIGSRLLFSVPASLSRTPHSYPGRCLPDQLPDLHWFEYLCLTGVLEDMSDDPAVVSDTVADEDAPIVEFLDWSPFAEPARDPG